MSAWPGKYVIGLTGNIATGKSVVRRMLEHLGAIGIDADKLAHRLMARGAPGFAPVLEAFGPVVLAADGEIDRRELGKQVFGTPAALHSLESILHPLVSQGLAYLIPRLKSEVVVIEAIKLIEAGLDRRCDALWVASAPREIQLERLVQRRGLTIEAARQRMDAQPPQQEKLALASSIVHSGATYAETWRMVKENWQHSVPIPVRLQPVLTCEHEYQIQLASPGAAGKIAQWFFPELAPQVAARPFQIENILAIFAEGAILTISRAGQTAGACILKMDNFIARSSRFSFSEAFQRENMTRQATVLRAALGEIERIAVERACESCLVTSLGSAGPSLTECGYQPRLPGSFPQAAWREAAWDLSPSGENIWFKQIGPSPIGSA